MRNFESRSSRPEKPVEPKADPKQSKQAAAGHAYKSRPTPPAGQPRPTAEIPPAGQPTAGAAHSPAGGRVYFSRRRGAQAAGAAGAKTSRFTPKQIRTNVLIGSLILVLILSLALTALLPGCRQSEAPVSSSSAAVSVCDSSSLSQPYDKDAHAIPTGKYAGTILEEGEDAGDDYVEETLFIGDSNTERMLHYRSVTGVTMSNGIGIESMGIGSVPGLRCVRFSGLADMTIPQAVAIMQPRRIVITFGTNNVGGYVDSFVKQYKTALDLISDAYPYADIIIGSVFPISQGCRYGMITQAGVDEFNLALVELAKQEGLKFLNWSEAIKDEKTGYAKAGAMIGDGVHVSEEGMKALFKYFRTHSHITEDTRPKPLKAIPTRLPTPEGLFPKPDRSSSSKSTASSDISRSKSKSQSASSQAPSSSAPPVSSVAPPPPSSSSQAPSSSSEEVVSSVAPSQPEEVSSSEDAVEPGTESSAE